MPKIQANKKNIQPMQVLHLLASQLLLFFIVFILFVFVTHLLDLLVLTSVWIVYLCCFQKNLSQVAILLNTPTHTHIHTHVYAIPWCRIYTFLSLLLLEKTTLIVHCLQIHTYTSHTHAFIRNTLSCTSWIVTGKSSRSCARRIWNPLATENQSHASFFDIVDSLLYVLSLFFFKKITPCLWNNDSLLLQMHNIYTYTYTYTYLMSVLYFRDFGEKNYSMFMEG